MNGHRRQTCGKAYGRTGTFAAVALASLLCGLLSACRAGEDHTPAAASFEYQRGLQGTGDSGQACVVLDAAVFGHAGSGAISDVRLYATGAANTREIPYVLTESAPEPGDVESVAIQGEQVRGNAVDFDLRMPPRLHSEIDLQIGLRDFAAMAQVTGGEVKAGNGKALGTVTVFDYTGQGLPRSTALHLGESNLPWVHVRLHVFDTLGKPFRKLNSPVVTGALVPPSREEEVLYTPVAETTAFMQNELESAATLAAPAHVPVERVRLELSREFRQDFQRKIAVSAHATGVGGEESFSGELGRVNRPDPAPGAPQIHYEQLSLPLLVGANLQTEATVRVALANEGKPPLPVRAVVLEMRRRSLCFEAASGVSYTLRYGNLQLRPPVYPYAQNFSMQAHPLVFGLGPEERNPQFVLPAKTNPREHSPELFWVLLVAFVALVGAGTLEWMRRSARTR